MRATPNDNPQVTLLKFRFICQTCSWPFSKKARSLGRHGSIRGKCHQNLSPFDDGIDKSISPGEPEERNIYEAIKEGKEVKKLPMSLGEALSYLEQNEVVRRGMPGEMYRLYHEYKYDEWARFMSTSTDWDNEMYMECLP